MFSWSNNNSSGGKRQQYPGNRTAQAVSGSIRPPTYTRQQHLDSLLNDATLKPSTRRVSSDDTTYDTVFQTTTGDALILRVRLPRGDGRVPSMTLVGIRASHPWLDSKMCVTGYTPIQNSESWKCSGMTLGTAVNSVIRQLQLEPPHIVEITDPGLERIQQKTSSQTSTTSSSSDAPPDYSSLTTASANVNVKMPKIPTTFPELETKTREELQLAVDDELEFLTLLHKLSVYQEIQLQGTTAMEKNAATAQGNLDKQTSLKALHAEVVQLQTNLKSSVSNFQELETIQNSKIAPPNTTKIQKELLQTKKQYLKQSEQVASDWMDNDSSDVDGFLEQFLKVRTKHHECAAKAERLQATTTTKA